ncbi:MAG: hypothetical protein HXS52_13065 [Theionarchaea archaeon]|nr:hypothetical protein [Theionarchaea archaeon]MBU7038855.1 hypothetical protein [Theionarchaea archaeon]
MAEKKKVDVDLPFLKVREDEEGSYVRVGPIEVKGKKGEEKVRVGPLSVSEGRVEVDRSQGRNLEGIAWAAFFILIGLVWTIQNVYHTNLEGAIPIGVGIIWLSLNFARSRIGIPISKATVGLGIVAIIYGVSQHIVEDVDVFALVLVALGIYLIIYFARKTS